MKKGFAKETFAIMGAILIGISGIVYIYMMTTPELETIPKARASLAAHEIAFYISVLSSVDKGSVMRDFNETYDVEIGQYSKFEKFKSTMDLGNYYVKVTLYDENGVKLATSDEISFVGFLDVKCEKGKTDACLKFEKTEIVFLEKKPDKPVDISAPGELLRPPSGPILGKGCKALDENTLNQTVRYYSVKYNVEEPFIKAVMAAESTFKQCKDENTIIHSVDPDTGNPVAWGYMQVTPDTASRLGIDYTEPSSNINGGVKLLSQYLNEERYFNNYTDKRELTAGAYNCYGVVGLVNKYCKGMQSGCWDKIKQYIGTGKEACTKSDETIPYVNKVMCYYNCYSLEENKDCYSISCCKGKC